LRNLQNMQHSEVPSSRTRQTLIEPKHTVR
jgi:hypothetical protein